LRVARNSKTHKGIVPDVPPGEVGWSLPLQFSQKKFDVSLHGQVAASMSNGRHTHKRQHRWWEGQQAKESTEDQAHRHH